MNDATKELLDAILRAMEIKTETFESSPENTSLLPWDR
jgi:hypothetical protein